MEKKYIELGRNIYREEMIEKREKWENASSKNLRLTSRSKSSNIKSNQHKKC